MENIFDIKFPIELKVKEKVILKFSNKQGGDYNIFSYYWQCFVWAATIGFLRNEKKSLATGTERIFNLKTMMSNDGDRDAKALICMCIARFGSVDIMKDPQEAIKMISEYANAGFYHIMQLMENGENTFNDMEKVKQEIFSRKYDYNVNTETKITDNDDTCENNNDDYSNQIETPIDNDDNTPWTDDDLEILTLYHRNGADSKFIAERLNRSEKAIKRKMAIMGFIELSLVFNIRNTSSHGLIVDDNNDVVFVTDGQLKRIGKKIYRFNIKPMCITVKEIIHINGKLDKSEKKLVAYSDSELFKEISNGNFIDLIEDFSEGDEYKSNKIKIEGVWYDYCGNMI